MASDDYVAVRAGGHGFVAFIVALILIVYLGALGVAAWYVMTNTHEIAENTDTSP